MGSNFSKNGSEELPLFNSEPNLPKSNVSRLLVNDTEINQSSVSFFGKKESAILRPFVNDSAVGQLNRKDNDIYSTLWKESKEGIPYVIHNGFKNKTIHQINRAIEEFHTKTPVKFKKIKEADIKKFESYISFYFSNEDTFSSVGRSKGDNPISIKESDEYNAIIHEIMHTLGFIHEHQREDRDLFVKLSKTINRDDSDFKKLDSFAFGPYDPESIMHYDLCRGLNISDKSLLTEEQSKNLKKFAETFSKGDLEALNFFYGGGSVKCSLEEYGSKFLSQAYYECRDCWGENSVMGCCIPCRFKCHKNHNVKYVDPLKELFFCDCGKNEHQLKCTFLSTGNQDYMQPIYQCKTCKKNDFCFPCSKKCHKGHEIVIEKSISFCKCTCKKY